jgi:hypothetical protein
MQGALPIRSGNRSLDAASPEHDGESTRIGMALDEIGGTGTREAPEADMEETSAMWPAAAGRETGRATPGAEF